MLWETDGESCDVCDCSSLITNAFTLSTNGGVGHTDDRLAAPHSCDSHLNITSQDMAYEETCTSPKKGNISTEDLSFYAGNSPQRNSPRSCLISTCLELSPASSPSSRFTTIRDDTEEALLLRPRQHMIVDDNDTNSMDSGYGAGYSLDIGSNGSNGSNGSSGSMGNSNTNTAVNLLFKFREPSGLAPRRVDPSPPKVVPKPITENAMSPLSGNGGGGVSGGCASISGGRKSGFRIFDSLSSGSMESMDDDYMDLYDLESLEDGVQLPSDLGSLITGDIKIARTTPDAKRPPLVRRCLSVNDATVTPLRGVRMALFEANTPDSVRRQRCFKRPDPPGICPMQIKRCKTELKTDDKENHATEERHTKSIDGDECMTLDNITIMSALARSSSEPDLIGDFSKPFCLPLTDGRHRDLKSISAETMARMLRGDFHETVSSFNIIDCRYPYEYDGGHIHGANNLYSQEQILETLVRSKKSESAADGVTSNHKRDILVFHCEFSSERGPKLSRFLRNHDRLQNTNAYPKLQYPEIYLLNGGYKDFYETYPDLCDPIAYRPMLDPSFCAAYKHFRAKSKSWNGDTRGLGATTRLVKSRSRLLL